LRHNFSKAASEYDARADFQHVQTRRVLDAALMLLPEKARVADIGCGTGYFVHAAKPLRPQWQVVGIDIAQGMCEIAATRCHAVVGDAAHLPLATGSVDAAVSSLCYQWVENLPVAFAELARVLAPGGRAIIASLGAESLLELRDAAMRADVPLGLLTMRSNAQVVDALTQAGFEVVMADCHAQVEYYASVSALMDSMRRIGAGNNFAPSARGMLSPKRWAALVAYYEQMRKPQGIPATWEYQFFILQKSR
jgi:malonyl-CoA O-methyltransferase